MDKKPTPILISEERAASLVVLEWRKLRPHTANGHTAASLVRVAHNHNVLSGRLSITQEEFDAMTDGMHCERITLHPVHGWRAAPAIYFSGCYITVEPSAQEATPAESMSLTDEQQKAIAQQVVAAWRKECPYHLWNDRLDDLANRAAEAQTGRDFGALIVTAEEYNKLVDGYVSTQTHWNAVHREAKRNEFKAALMFVHGGVTIARQPADTTLPELEKPDPVVPSEPVLHTVLLEPLAVPIAAKTTTGGHVSIASMSDQTYEAWIEQFTTSMRKLRATVQKGKQ